MKWKCSVWLLMICLLSGCDGAGGEQPANPVTVRPVEKTNAMKLYMHYMPWFQSKAVSGFWGSHWRMTNKNPDNVDGDGKREIASHYYPLIGPYDSSDEDVLEYHLLLMKYAGVDGVLIDWYGSQNVYDYRANLTGSNALIALMDKVGLKFAVVYEEYTAGAVHDQTGKSAVAAAQEDMTYLKANYFSKPEHITIGTQPLLLTFGPRYFKSGAQWDQIFTVFPNPPSFLPLWDHGTYTGTTDSGEFSWVDFNASLTGLDGFYKKNYIGVLMGSAYPRFHDFYEEGGTGTSYGYVDFNNGDTFRNTLDLAKDHGLEYLQLVTWNDFGEGTVIEPTLEDGFTCLEILQEFAGVSYDESELQLIHAYYQKKVQYKNTEPEKLNKIFTHLTALEVDEARALLNELE